MKTNTTNIAAYGNVTKKTTDQIIIDGKMVAQRLGKAAWEVYVNHQLVINDEEEGITMYNANYVRVDGTLTYANIVNAFITDTYTASEREGMLRKGILDATDVDYIAFNNFAESIKKSVKWAIPEETDPDLILAAAKKELKEKIKAYDVSDNVNSFILNGRSMWLPTLTRMSLRANVSDAKALGEDTVTFIFNGKKYVAQTDTAEQMLIQLEIYAKKCYNITQQHYITVDTITELPQCPSYDYTADYPSIPNFVL